MTKYSDSVPSISVNKTTSWSLSEMGATELINWRKFMGLPQAQAADMLGVSRRTMGKYEANEAPIARRAKVLYLAYASAFREVPINLWAVIEHGQRLNVSGLHGSVWFKRTKSGALILDDAGDVPDAQVWDAFRAVLQHHKGVTE